MNNNDLYNQTKQVRKTTDSSKSFNKSLVVLSIILLVLVLISLTILLTRLGKVLPNDGNVFYVDPNLDNVEYGDDEQIWDLQTEIKIFSVAYSNQTGEVYVEALNGEKVIAPGTEGRYKFEIRNLSNLALSAKTILDTEFYVENMKFDNLPIELCLTDYEGNYVTPNGWVSVSEFEQCISELTIGRKSYVYYNLDWRWPYESSADDVDTLLGNLSMDSIVELKVNVSASACQHPEYDATGGLPVIEESQETEKEFLPIYFFILNLLIVTVISAMIIIQIIKRKKLSQQINSYNKKK